jgi:hypothetical protein
MTVERVTLKRAIMKDQISDFWRPSLHIVSWSFLLVVIFCFPALAAHAANEIQMLPPTMSNNVSPCAASVEPQVLFYNAQAVSDGTSFAGSAINCISGFTMDPATGNLAVSGIATVTGQANLNGGISINQGWSQGLSINSNQIWKSVSTGDPSLYLQSSNPGGAVVIGGQPGATNNLAVQGNVIVHTSDGVQAFYVDGSTGNAFFGTNLVGSGASGSPTTGTIVAEGLSINNFQAIFQMGFWSPAGVAFGSANQAGINADGTSWFASVDCGSGCTRHSDVRLKTDLRQVNGGLDVVMALKPVTWLWKDAAKNKALVTDSEKTARQYGFVAQDVEKVLPDLVHRASFEGKPDTLSLDYDGIIAPLVKAVQEQQAEIQEQQAEIGTLKARLAKH